QVDDRVDAVLDLEKGRRYLSVQNLSKDRQIPPAEFESGDVRIQPAPNETIRLLVGQRSVAIGILFDQCAFCVRDFLELTVQANDLAGAGLPAISHQKART